MSTRWWARSSILGFAPAIGDLAGLGRNGILGQTSRLRLHPPNDPVRECAAWSVRILHHQCEAPRLARHLREHQRWTDVLPFAGVLLRNHGALFKSRTRDLHSRLPKRWLKICFAPSSPVGRP